MKLRPKITLIDHLEKLTDPRVERTKDHKLIDILVIALCAMRKRCGQLGGYGNLWKLEI